MERLYVWPANPGASLLFLWLLSQVFFYAARAPMHRAFDALARVIGGGLRLAARLCRGMAATVAKRDHELVVDLGKSDLEARIGREFHRIEGTFAKELERYPEVHRKLDDTVARLEADYKECGTVAPSAPGWTRSCSRRCSDRRSRARRRRFKNSAMRRPSGTASSARWRRCGRS
jgi:hypothetical protein